MTPRKQWGDLEPDERALLAWAALVILSLAAAGVGVSSGWWG